MGPITWQIRDLAGLHSATEVLHPAYQSAVAVFLDGTQHCDDPTQDDPTQVNPTQVDPTRAEHPPPNARLTRSGLTWAWPGWSVGFMGQRRADRARRENRPLPILRLRQAAHARDHAGDSANLDPAFITS